MSNLEIEVWKVKDNNLKNIRGKTIIDWYYNSSPKVKNLSSFLDKNSKRIREEFIQNIDSFNKIIINSDDNDKTKSKKKLWNLSTLKEKSPYKISRLTDCLKIISLNQIIKKEKAKKLIFVSNDIELSKSISKISELNNIKFSFRHVNNDEKNLNFKKKTILHRIASIFPAPIYAIIKFTYVNIKKGTLTRKGENNFFSGKKSIFLFSYFVYLNFKKTKSGIFSSKQWGSLNEFLRRKSFKINFCQHLFFSPGMENSEKTFRYLDKINDKSKAFEKHFFFENYLTLKIFLVIIFKFILFVLGNLNLILLKNKLKSKKLQFAIFNLLKNNYIDSFFGYSAIENFFYMEVFDVLFKKIPKQKVGIYLMENHPWEKAFISSWKKNGHGILIGYPHSTVNFWHLNYYQKFKKTNDKFMSFKVLDKIFPDYVACSGPIILKYFNDLRYPSEKLLRVESLRYTSPSRRNKQFKASKKRNKVLIIGDYLPEHTHYMLNQFNSLDLKTIKSCDFYFKPHPATFVDLNNYKKLNLKKVNLDISRIINSFHLAFSPPSTSALIEALDSKCKIFIFLNKSQIDFSPFKDLTNIEKVYHCKEMENILKGLKKNQRSINKFSYFWYGKNLNKWNKSLLLASKKGQFK